MRDPDRYLPWPAPCRAASTGFEVADLREGAESIGRLWARLTDEPLPAHHDFRMRTAES